MVTYKKQFITKLKKLFEGIYHVEHLTEKNDDYPTDTIIIMIPKSEDASSKEDFTPCVMTFLSFNDDDYDGENMLQINVTVSDYVEAVNEMEFFTAMNYTNSLCTFANFNLNPLNKSLVCKYTQFIHEKEKQDSKLNRVESTFAMILAEMNHFYPILLKIAEGKTTLEESISAGEFF